MTQNLIDLEFSEQQLRDIDAALAVLEANLAGLIGLTAVQRHRLYKMGANSESFCRQAVLVLAQNPGIVPPTLDVAAAQADLMALDQLRDRSVRLKRLMARVEDSEMALGSDVLGVARTGYKLMQMIGPSQGLEAALRDLEPRFQRARRAGTEAPETA